MFQKNNEISRSELAELLNRPEAKALLLRLQQMDQTALQNAVNLAFRGDAAGARDVLSPMMADPEVRKLTDQMRNGHGGI